MKIKCILAAIILFILASCQNTRKEKASVLNLIEDSVSFFKKGEYGYDLEFIRKYLKPVELVNGKSRLMVIPEYQGRVLTSTSSGMHGYSYGWINYDLIASSKILEDFNPYGGEERIWLGPEGGQFSLFFEKGSSFKNGKWIVPAPFDREPFILEKSDSNSVTLSRDIELKNYSGTVFKTKVTRTVNLLNSNEIDNILGIKYDQSVRVVGFMSENRLKNTGTAVWNRETGALSIWMLTMFNASPEVTVVFPYRKGDYGKIVTDDYLVKIPSDRLKVTERAVFFRTDANFRSKIGISPKRAMPFVGSYDSKNKVLTILEYSLPETATDYVNSALELQKNPFSGDVINSYNDGPKKDGTRMGEYYEIETSSPAAFLKPGEEIIHTQRIFHFEGNEIDLDQVSKKYLNVTIEEIKNSFNN
jgi:hypothetical protein